MSTTLGWRLRQRRDARRSGRCRSVRSTRLLGEKFGIPVSGRTSSPPASHNLAHQAWRTASTTTGHPVDGTDLTRDEAIRPGSTAEKLAGLKPSFRPTVPHRRQRFPAERRRIALLLALRARSRAWSRSPACRPRHFANDPRDFGFAPSRPPIEHSGARASAGPTSQPSSSTKPSRPVLGVRRRVARQRPRRRRPRQRKGAHRHRTPPRRLRRPVVATLAHRLARRGTGGAGCHLHRRRQALAVVLENSPGVEGNLMSQTEFFDTADAAVAARGRLDRSGRRFRYGGMPVTLIDALIRQGATD